MKRVATILACLILLLTMAMALFTGERPITAQGSEKSLTPKARVSIDISPKIKGGLGSYLNSQENVPVIVDLSYSFEAGSSVAEIKDRANLEKEQIRKKIKQINSKYGPTGTWTDEDKALRRELNLQVEAIGYAMRSEIAKAMQGTYKGTKQEIEELVVSLGGKVMYSPLPNSLTLEIPGTALESLATNTSIVSLYYNGIYSGAPELDISPHAINVTNLPSGISAVEGQQMITGRNQTLWLLEWA